MPGRPTNPTRFTTLAYWLPGIAAACVAAGATWLASDLGASAVAVGIGGGAAVALVGGALARRRLARRLARRARRLDGELGERPPGAMPVRRSPEEVLEQVYARERARLVLVKERARAELDVARREQQAALDTCLRELAEVRAAAADTEGELARLREQEALVANTLGLPLAAATGALDLALAGERGAEQRRLLELARSSTATSVSVLEHLADRGEEASPAISSRARYLSPRRAIVQTLRRLAPEAERRGVELVARFAGGVPSRAEADRERLELALVTLVGWTLSRSRMGCVTVDVGVTVPRRDDPTELALVVALEDDGPPLGADAISGVPELALVARLVAAAGGEAEVESSTFAATRVAFSTPIARRKRVTATTLYGRGAVTDKTVLVVDDQASSRTVLSELVAGWRLLPTAVSSASAALSALRAAARAGEPFDLVLVDRHLGEEDGLELVRAVAGEAALGPQRVILLEHVADLARPLPTDVRDSVVGRALKPILPEELIAVFTAVLAPPRAAPKIQPRRPRSRASGARALRVLVAEDNPVNQIFVARLLEKRGHLVTVANNGADVIDSLDVAEEPFDVILMDIQMPVLDGLEATGIIRERERRAGEGHIPIIAVTAHVLRGEERRILDVGLDAYVPKPVQEERLFEAIARLLPADEPEARVTAEDAVSIAAVPEAPPARIFDEAKILSFVAGDTDFLVSLVDLFVETSPKQVAAIGDAIASADPAALARTAHQLKGSVGNFGADRARHWAFELEKAGRDGSLEGAEAVLERLSGEVEALRVALRDLADRRV